MNGASVLSWKYHISLKSLCDYRPGRGLILSSNESGLISGLTSTSEGYGRHLSPIPNSEGGDSEQNFIG
jgi:hypothetical protein